MAATGSGEPPAHMRSVDMKVCKVSARLKVACRVPLKNPKELRASARALRLEKRSAASLLANVFGSLELTRLVEEYTGQRRSFAPQSYDCQGWRRSSVCEMKISLGTPGQVEARKAESGAHR